MNMINQHNQYLDVRSTHHHHQQQTIHEAIIRLALKMERRLDEALARPLHKQTIHN